MRKGFILATQVGQSARRPSPEEQVRRRSLLGSYKGVLKLVYMYNMGIGTEGKHKLPLLHHTDNSSVTQYQARAVAWVARIRVRRPEDI